MSLKEGYAAWQMQEMSCAKNAFQKALQHAEPKSDTALKASHALAAIRKNHGYGAKLSFQVQGNCT